MRLVTRNGMVATILAVGAIAAPSAQAFPLEGMRADPHATAQPAALSAHPTYSDSTWVVRPNPDEQSPAASTTWVVRPNPDEQSPASTPSTQSPASTPSTQSPASTPSIVTPRHTAPVTAVRNSPGFQFGDAAIGAGLMTGLLLLGTAGTLAVRRRGLLGQS
jgi:hypothetical protein